MLKKQYLLSLIGIGWLIVATNSINAQSMTTLPANVNQLSTPYYLQTAPNLGHSSTTYSSITQVSFNPPPDDGKPDKTRGAGSRQYGQCPEDTALISNTNSSLFKPVLTALVPYSNYGLTTAERPTFLVYLPKTSAKQIVLSLKEEGINHYSQTVIPITQSPGIIKIKPSDNTPPLEINKNYQWAAVLICGQRPSPNDPAIASWVRRVTLASPYLKQKTPLEQAVLYGERGIWYDCVVALAEAKHSQSHQNSMTQIWANFLTSAGLQEISQEILQF